MPLVKRYRPGPFPQFTQADDNLKGYLRDEFNRIALLLNDMGAAVDSQRNVLNQNVTFFVRTDGNDANDGLSNTAAGAFLTVQRAIDALSDLDFNGFTPEVHVAAGTYNGEVVMTAPFLGGVAKLIGDTTTPSNVVLNTVAGVSLSNQSALSIAGFKLVSSGSACLFVDLGSFVNIFGKMEYGAAASARIFANRDSFVDITAAYTVSGNSQFMLLASSDSKIIHNGAVAVTLTGTPVFSAANVWSQIGSLIYLDLVTWSGGATGTRFVVSEGANITTGGKALTFIPGTIAGVQQLNGVYS